jgi:hypothetical protein
MAAMGAANFPPAGEAFGAGIAAGAAAAFGHRGGLAPIGGDGLERTGIAAHPYDPVGAVGVGLGRAGGAAGGEEGAESGGEDGAHGSSLPGSRVSGNRRVKDGLTERAVTAGPGFG